MKSTGLLEPPPKGEGGGKQEWLQEHKGKETSSGFQNHLELSLGISLNSSSSSSNKLNNISSEGKAAVGGPNPRFLTTLDGFVLNQRNGFGPKRWFSEPGCGFIHPWSLAARQQKAIFEQAHQNPNPSSCSSPHSTVPSAAPPPPQPPPVVGWPPVRAFRRNLGGNSHPPKPEMDGEKDTKRAKMTEVVTAEIRPEVPATMFVKVNMEGFAVGRKINLKAHYSYESLSRALQRMFTNFLSTNYSNNSKEEEQDEVPTPDYILLYEDHEGDRMLVGDVPWEMFITSVKRLYIAHSRKSPSSDDGRVAVDENR